MSLTSFGVVSPSALVILGNYVFADWCGAGILTNSLHSRCRECLRVCDELLFVMISVSVLGRPLTSACLILSWSPTSWRHDASVDPRSVLDWHLVMKVALIAGWNTSTRIFSTRFRDLVVCS